MFTLVFAVPADAELKRLEGIPTEAGLVKQIKKALGNLQRDPRYPALQTHKFSGLTNPYNPKEPVFEAYAQQNTPGASRIIWCYGPHQKQKEEQRDRENADTNNITIMAIIAHP